MFLLNCCRFLKQLNSYSTNIRDTIQFPTRCALSKGSLIHRHLYVIRVSSKVFLRSFYSRIILQLCEIFGFYDLCSMLCWIDTYFINRAFTFITSYYFQELVCEVVIEINWQTYILFPKTSILHILLLHIQRLLWKVKEQVIQNMIINDECITRKTF